MNFSKMDDDWKTLEVETIEIGGSNFIELNLKQPPGSDQLLYGISKGWFNEEGKKRYKTNILFSQDAKEKIVEALTKLDERKESL